LPTQSCSRNPPFASLRNLLQSSRSIILTVHTSFLHLPAQLLIQAGYSDHAIDVETRHLLAQASEQEEADEGVYSTLLVALQTEYEALQGERHRQEQQLEEMKQR
jgi:hypothetical protein